MGQATINVQYVNQPRSAKGPGSVKDDQGRYWKVWATSKNGGAALSQFQAGKSYDITYETEQYEGKDQHTIVRAAARGAPVPAHNGNGTRQATAPTDAERMFTCSILNAFVAAGKVDLRQDSLESSVNMLRGVWQQTFGADA